MIHDGLEFHNVEELEPCCGGSLLHRFPASVRKSQNTNELARFVMQKGMGTEVRFVTDAKRVRISVGALEEPNHVIVMKGDFTLETRMIEPGTTTHMVLNHPVGMGYYKPDYYDRCLFDPAVWRIWFGRQCGIFCGVDTFGAPVRPPAPAEKPATAWLAYGSSFTMGASAISHYNNYPNIAARMLGWDVMNLGMGGSCHAETHVADYIASRDDWHVATLRVGGNMIGEIEPDEYRRRIEHLVDATTLKHPGKPVVLIGLSSSKLRFNREIKIWQEHTLAYEKIDREIIAARADRKNLYHLPANDLMPTHTAIFSDMLHPDDYGHFEIARHLADKFRAWGIAAPLQNRPVQ